MKKELASNKINKNPAGFSMMEVVLSVFLLSTGLVAAVQLMSRGLATSMDSRDQLIATGLAQEGVELVRNIRDNNWSNGVNSFTYMPSPDNAACRIDRSYVYLNNMSCSKTIPERRLYLDNTTNLYKHSITDASATKFYRNISVASNASGSKTITSMVSWNGAFPAITDCFTKNRCTYTQITLTTWGE
jgi:Tfp pilus assembly protein PilV